METLALLKLLFNLLSAPFGFLAVYYGYLGYKVTKRGLKSYTYFFFAMIALGAVMLIDLLRIIGIVGKFDILLEVLLLITAVCMMLAFRVMWQFLAMSQV